MVLTQPLDQHARALGKARANEPAVAPRGAPADVPPLDQHDRPAALGQQPRRVQAGKASADHRDIGPDSV